MRTVGLSANSSLLVLHVGQRLRVVLAPDWTAPRAVAPDAVTAPLQPLRTDSAVGYPAPGSASATFTAVRSGVALVSAHTDSRCLHTHPMCALPVHLFSLTAKVLPAPGTPAGPLPRSPAG
jgi:hypothetical protein